MGSRSQPGQCQTKIQNPFGGDLTATLPVHWLTRPTLAYRETRVQDKLAQPIAVAAFGGTGSLL